MVSAQAAIGDVVPPRERGQVDGAVRRGLRRVERRRPAHRRLPDEQRLVAVDLLRQRARSGCVALGVLARDAAERGRAGRARRRLRRHRAARGRAERARARDDARRDELRLGLAVHRRPGRDRASSGIVAFVFAERRAKEPILPPSLFRNRVFVVTSAVGLVVGFALFGGLTFLPLFQQVVRGDTPTESGLAAAAGDGRAAVHLDRLGPDHHAHRPLPLVPDRGHRDRRASGCSCSRRWTADTSTALAALYMLIFGMGLGMVMQVLVLAVQNAVEYEQLGVATSGRDAVPLDRRLARDRAARRGVLEQVGRRTGGRSARRARAAGPRRTWRAWTRPPSGGSRQRSATPTSPRSPTRSTSCSSWPRGSWRSRSC